MKRQCKMKPSKSWRNGEFGRLGGESNFVNVCILPHAINLDPQRTAGLRRMGGCVRFSFGIDHWIKRLGVGHTQNGHCGRPEDTQIHGGEIPRDVFDEWKLLKSALNRWNKLGDISRLPTPSGAGAGVGRGSVGRREIEAQRAGEDVATAAHQVSCRQLLLNHQVGPLAPIGFLGTCDEHPIGAFFSSATAQCIYRSSTNRSKRHNKIINK